MRAGVDEETQAQDEDEQGAAGKCRAARAAGTRPKAWSRLAAQAVRGADQRGSMLRITLYTVSTMWAGARSSCDHHATLVVEEQEGLVGEAERHQGTGSRAILAEEDHPRIGAHRMMLVKKGSTTR